MAKRKEQITRDAALDMMVAAGLISQSVRSMVSGTRSIEFGSHGVDADARGLYNRDEVCRMIVNARVEQEDRQCAA